jgi:hypothetical protein
MATTIAGRSLPRQPGRIEVTHDDIDAAIEIVVTDTRESIAKDYHVATYSSRRCALRRCASGVRMFAWDADSVLEICVAQVARMASIAAILMRSPAGTADAS